MRILLIVILWAAGLLPPAQADDLTPGYWEQTPLPHTGLATFYAAGMMEHVLAVRAGHGQVLRCDECVGTVALLRAGDIGRKVWLQPPGGERVGPFLVIDCARREDIPPLVARNWAVDVSYEVGQLWGMDRPLADVTVLADPADQGYGDRAWGPLPAPTPFFVPPDKVALSAPTPTPRISPTPWQPTPWPTRRPAPLIAPGSSASDRPTPPAPPTAIAGPMPLTPVVTTPTPRVTAPAVRLSPTAAAFPRGAAPPLQDAAVGRPGSGLLMAGPAPVASPTGLARPTATPTPARPPAIAPAVTSPPILPRGPTAAATPPAESGGVVDLLRRLLGLPRP